MTLEEVYGELPKIYGAGKCTMNRRIFRDPYKTGGSIG